jgi:hypothetical protein
MIQNYHLFGTSAHSFESLIWTVHYGCLIHTTSSPSALVPFWFILLQAIKCVKPKMMTNGRRIHFLAIHF